MYIYIYLYNYINFIYIYIYINYIHVIMMVFCLSETWDINRKRAIHSYRQWIQMPKRQNVSWETSRHSWIPGLVNIQKAIENGHWNSGFTHEKMWFSIFLVDLHSYKRVDLSIVFCMFTRGYVWCYCVSLEVWVLITSPARSVTCDISIFNDSTVQDQGCVQDSVA